MKVYLVYQDCPMCGAREGWGERQTEFATKNGYEVVKLGFYTDLAESFATKAIEAGIKGFPYFTDGKIFAKNLDDFDEKLHDRQRSVEEVPVKSARIAKNHKKKTVLSKKVETKEEKEHE